MIRSERCCGENEEAVLAYITVGWAQCGLLESCNGASALACLQLPLPYGSEIHTTALRCIECRHIQGNSTAQTGSPARARWPYKSGKGPIPYQQLPRSDYVHRAH